MKSDADADAHKPASKSSRYIQGNIDFLLHSTLSDIATQDGVPLIIIVREALKQFADAAADDPMRSTTNLQLYRIQSRITEKDQRRRILIRMYLDIVTSGGDMDEFYRMCDETKLNADQIIALAEAEGLTTRGRGRPRDTSNRAAVWLEDLMNTLDEDPSLQMVLQLAKQAGFSRYAVEQARRYLGIETKFTEGVKIWLRGSELDGD